MRCDELRLSTGIAEVDRVLGGGVVAGSVVLLAGEPGIGKSTLVLQLLQGVVRAGGSCVLVSGEESLAQTGLRAARLGIPLDGVRAASSTSLQAVIAASERERPDVLVIDSIQTIEDAALEQPAGSVVQVRESASALVRHAKSTGVAVILVGHVTKDGAVAGPKTLEHVVDAVVTLEGERGGGLRLLRAAKNRFGSCDETGVFTMSRHGLEAVGDASAMLLADRRPGATGSVVFPGMEGSRPVLVEIQALVTGTKLPQPRRVAIGVDARRVTLLLGVLCKGEGMSFGTKDVFVAAAGGLAVREPAADLAMCLALFSGLEEVAISGDIIAIGEVGLAGEVRRVPAIDRRLTEAARLGFSTAIVPQHARVSRADMKIVAVGHIDEALHACARKGFAA
ncbi:DNA repair protein RadA [soil metagenome]